MDPADLLPDGTVRTGNADYDELPRPIKDLHSLEQWLWLGNLDKHTLQQTETEPEF